MTDIRGIYAFHGRDPYVRLRIQAVMADGAIDAELADGESSTKVYGTYDETTNRFSFSEAATPAETLLNAFFKGFAILDGGAEGTAPAGTWTEQRLSYGQG